MFTCSSSPGYRSRSIRPHNLRNLDKAAGRIHTQRSSLSLSGFGSLVQRSCRDTRARSGQPIPRRLSTQGVWRYRWG
uniref:Uncharacterized protein n=1 Tax=Physcomitrium patens TaxID=3218 RepID=A0A2K1JDL0_PHYPA|nr:hypothetical protein PHYPA_019894 [Physcomitrium patens]